MFLASSWIVVKAFQGSAGGQSQTIGSTSLAINPFEAKRTKQRHVMSGVDMTKIIYSTEDEGLPVAADGYVVCRDQSGRTIICCPVGDYTRTTKDPQPIPDCHWTRAISVATYRAAQQDATVYVIWG